MALSMEEQRILAEIEQHLTRDEPVLAGRLSKLEHPRPTLAGVLRSPRGRMLASLTALVMLVLMSTLVYLLISLRGMPQRGINGRPSSGPHHPVSALNSQLPTRMPHPGLATRELPGSTPSGQGGAS